MFLHLTAERTRHPGVLCDVCMGRVEGLRFKCRTCHNYDLCEDCMANRAHTEHTMRLIRHPIEVNIVDI